MKSIYIVAAFAIVFGLIYGRLIKRTEIGSEKQLLSILISEQRKIENLKNIISLQDSVLMIMKKTLGPERKWHKSEITAYSEFKRGINELKVVHNRKVAEFNTIIINDTKLKLKSKFSTKIHIR